MNFIFHSIFLLLLVIVRFTPIKFLPIYIFILSRFFYHLQVRKNVICINLNLAFGESNDAKRKQLIKDVYINAATVLVELLKLDSMNQKDIEKIYLKHDYHQVKNIKKKNQGLIILGGHISNWELDTYALSVLGHPNLMFTGSHRNKKFGERLNQIRDKFTTVIANSKNSSYQMNKALDQGHILVFASDQNVPNRKLFVNFFDIPASFGRGAITFALKKKIPLIMAWSVRKSLFQYEGFIQEIKYDVSHDIKNDIRNVAQLVSDQFQTIIEEHPEQYFWFNKRWKTRPLTTDSSFYS